MCSRGMCLPEDRISSLPDDVLLVTLSFLPLNEVVKTSILSHRWLNLWEHTPVLDFHARIPKDTLRNSHMSKVQNDRECRNYVQWVNRVLRRHKGQYLKEFKIVCEFDKHNQKDIDRWLVFALAKKVQCLELNLLIDGLEPCNLDNIYAFPGPFLDLGSYGGKSQFLQSDLKCLKSLSLKRVDVTDEAINFFLLNCPFLERLEVVGSLKLVNLVISDPTSALKYLKIRYCRNFEVLSISNINLVSLDISSVGDLTLTGLPMLVEFFISGVSDVLSHSISQASSCFPQLEAFTFRGNDLKDVTQLSNYDQLTKLKRLVINVRAGGDESLTNLISIINSCPRLEEFVLMLRWFKPNKLITGTTICEVERQKSEGSSLKNNSLKVFEFGGYYGHATHVELIMHVVETAVSLEKIIIDPRDVLLISRPTFWTKREEEARSNALQQFDSLRKSIPTRIHLLLH